MMPVISFACYLPVLVLVSRGLDAIEELLASSIYLACWLAPIELNHSYNVTIGTPLDTNEM